MPTRTVNGTNIHYQERGQGRPLVLLHGFPLDSRIFQPQIDALSDSYRVIAPDLRGFGQSRSDEPFTIESLAQDMHELLAQLDALPCVLAGLSMGGYVALAFFRKWPTDVDGLILIDSRAAGDTPENKQGRDKMIQLVREKGSKAVAEAMLPRVVCEQCDPRAKQMIQQIMESCSPVAVENALKAMRDRMDYSSELPSISDPTLVIVGLRDQITPHTLAEEMKGQIPNATLAVIPDAGHLTPMEQPGPVTEAIRKFVDGLPE